MTRPVYYQMGGLVVRVVLDEDFEETPLYADWIDTQTGLFVRDNRLIDQILSGEFCEPITEAEIKGLTSSARGDD